VSVVAALAPAAAAASAGTATPTTTAPTSDAASPPAKPKHGAARIYIRHAFFLHRNAVTVPKRNVGIDGVVRPFVPRQRVTVKAMLGRRAIKTAVLRVRPSKNGRFGEFHARIATRSAGAVTVKVTHTRTIHQQGFHTSRRYSVLAEDAHFGSLGHFVQLIQQRLRALHIYIPQTGVYDTGTGLALDAYHRLLGWGHSETLDPRTITWLLNGWGQFKVRYPNQGKHVEGDLSHQLLALINGSNVYRIYPISSGKPSTPTILGTFHVYSKVPGYLPDGMYYSNFFIRGYAMHGYDPAPDYPASHGCMRLPIRDAISVYDWVAIGDTVDTYYR
jgi:lipoprotein-anchoring transpeptidase ErfK/SrfK